MGNTVRMCMGMFGGGKLRNMWCKRENREKREGAGTGRWREKYGGEKAVMGSF